MPENTFDIVSKLDLQEVANAIQQALKEIHTRFDLKDSKSNIELEGKEAIVLHSIDEYKLKAVTEIFQQKLVKRGVSLKGLTYGPVEPAAGATAKQKITMQQGIAIEKAKEIVKVIKDSKTKVNGIDSGGPGAGKRERPRLAAASDCAAAAEGFRHRFAVHELPDELGTPGKLNASAAR